MRYVHQNADGSIGLWATVPQAIIRHSDGAAFRVIGVRRRAGQCIVYGGWPDGTGEEFIVGDEAFDVSDMPVNHLPGYTIVFPDFAADIMRKLPEETRSKIVSHRKCVRADIPGDRYFRGAWIDAGKIDVDMPKAREIHKDRLRRERAPLLDALDTEYMRADELGDIELKAEIAAKKQALRDITDDPAIESAKTPEELKAVRPPALDGAATVRAVR